MNCPNCKGESVMDGMLTGYCGVTFVEAGTENKLRPNAHKVTCKACNACGHIFDFRIVKKAGKEK